jgi:hypothetical protein
MARGFDSKSVTDQQEEAEQERERSTSRVPPASPQRRKLELARTDLQRRIDAVPESRRDELRVTLDALDDLIRRA